MEAFINVSYCHGFPLACSAHHNGVFVATLSLQADWLKPVQTSPLIRGMYCVLVHRYIVCLLKTDLKITHSIASLISRQVVTTIMPTYKLYYFNCMGRGELIRWIFIQAGVPFEDIRLTDQEWSEFKSKTPYGRIPVLEIDRKMLAGSGPIARYVAEEFGFAASSAFENADIASLYDLIDDIQDKMVLMFFEKDETRQTELKKELTRKDLPEFLGILEKQITDNGSPEGWIYGSKVTYVDLSIVLTMGYVVMIDPSILDGYPAICKLKTTVESLPNIAKWIQERPKTDH